MSRQLAYGYIVKRQQMRTFTDSREVDSFLKECKQEDKENNIQCRYEVIKHRLSKDK